jgi:hypothetical protein
MDFRTYIQNEISKLDNGTISFQELLNELCNKIQNETGRTLDENTIASLSSYLSKYQNNEIGVDSVVSYLQNIINSSNVPYSPGSGGRKPSDSTDSHDEEVVDVDVDVVLDASEQYSDVESIISSTDIDIPSSITPYAGKIKETVASGKTKNQETLSTSKDSLVSLLQTVEDLDEEIVSGNYGDFDFNDIWALAYNKKTGSHLKAADINFFMQNKDCIVNGNEVTFTKNGKTYKYNLSTKLLSVNGDSVRVGFFIPDGTKEYSKLNTFTYFIADGYDNPTGYPSDSLVVRFLKSDVQSRDSRGNHKFGKQKMVAEATRFMNGVARTDLSKCQNIIGGDSLYGAESLKLAANNGDLYQTVYCVNNAVLVTGKNAIKGEKVQFSSIEELKGLEGKNLYFISATGDRNFDHCAKNGGGWVSCGYNEGYVFTGLDLVAKNCPSANIYLVYSQKGKQSIKNHYAKLDRNYSNVHYLSDKWNQFAKKDYQTHTDGNRIMPELVSAAVTSFNGYSL